MYLNNQQSVFPQYQVKAKCKHFWLECMNEWGVLLKKQVKALLRVNRKKTGDYYILFWLAEGIRNYSHGMLLKRFQDWENLNFAIFSLEPSWFLDFPFCHFFSYLFFDISRHPGKQLSSFGCKPELLFFGLFRTTPVAHGGSQARGRTRTIAAGLYHSSRQRRILNPLSRARDPTRNLMVPSQIC